jgi:hypothetical protein
VACWRENLCHEEAVAIVFVLHGDIVYVTFVGAFAALRERNALGPNPPRIVPCFSRARTDSYYAIGLGHSHPLAAVGQVEAMWSRLLKDAHPLAEETPVPSGAHNSRLALDHHKNHFAIPLVSETVSSARSRHRQNPT